MALIEDEVAEAAMAKMIADIDEYLFLMSSPNLDHSSLVIDYGGTVRDDLASLLEQAGIIEHTRHVHTTGHEHLVQQDRFVEHIFHWSRSQLSCASSMQMRTVAALRVHSTMVQLLGDMGYVSGSSSGTRSDISAHQSNSVTNSTGTGSSKESCAELPSVYILSAAHPPAVQAEHVKQYLVSFQASSTAEEESESEFDDSDLPVWSRKVTPEEAPKSKQTGLFVSEFAECWMRLFSTCNEGVVPLQFDRLVVQEINRMYLFNHKGDAVWRFSGDGPPFSDVSAALKLMSFSPLYKAERYEDALNVVGDVQHAVQQDLANHTKIYEFPDALLCLAAAFRCIIWRLHAVRSQGSPSSSQSAHRGPDLLQQSEIELQDMIRSFDTHFFDPIVKAEVFFNIAAFAGARRRLLKDDQSLQDSIMWHEESIRVCASHDLCWADLHNILTINVCRISVQHADGRLAEVRKAEERLRTMDQFNEDNNRGQLSLHSRVRQRMELLRIYRENPEIAQVRQDGRALFEQLCLLEKNPMLPSGLKSEARLFIHETCDFLNDFNACT